MMVRTLHAQTHALFSDNDQRVYAQAVERLCASLARAMRSNHLAQTAGNQFREQFQASLNGRRATYRIDIEVAGRLAPA